MKKVIAGVVIILFIVCVLVQNEGRIILIALSQHRLVNPFELSSITVPNGKQSSYKNGTFTGPVVDAFYGNIQVRVIVSNGRISDIQFLQHPSDALRSVAINDLAMPNLKQEAIQAQSASVAIVTGATDTSNAFIQSLKDALNQAKS